MKKFFKNLFLAVFSLLVLVSVSNAAILSNADIYRNSQKLDELYNFDVSNNSFPYNPRCVAFNMFFYYSILSLSNL